MPVYLQAMEAVVGYARDCDSSEARVFSRVWWLKQGLDPLEL